MAIFTAEEYGGVIEQCLLDGEDVTRLATCANIPIVTFADIPPSTGALVGVGWIDLLETTKDGYPYLIVDDNDEPRTTRHHGKIRLIWKKEA